MMCAGICMYIKANTKHIHTLRPRQRLCTHASLRLKPPEKLPEPAPKAPERLERFLASDLPEADPVDVGSAKFEFQPKTGRINMRLPESLLTAVKAIAAARGIPYQRFIRQIIEQAVSSQHNRK